MTRRFDRSLLGQLTQRKVTRVAIAYVMVGWLAMQVGEVSFEALGLPPWSLTLLIVFIAVGFPVALVIAWAYEVTPRGIRKDLRGEWSGAYAEGSMSDQASIAVLPFYDMSEQRDQAYLCEGLAEEILNALCKIEGLRVASRVSSFQAGRKRSDVIRIGRLLRVQHVLEGAVRKQDDQLRINVELVNTADGYHLWSRQYNRSIENVFEIEREVAQSVARVFQLSLDSPAEPAARPANAQAFECLLRGNSLFSRRALRDIRRARDMFLRALEFDPNYGRAWAGLASTYGFEYMCFDASDVNREEALQASARAVELMPGRAESHVLSGIANCMSHNFGLADQAFQRALEIDPGNFDAAYFYARTKVREGDLRQALELFRRAADLRPDDYESVLLQAQLHVSLGDEESALAVSREGIARARRALEIDPDDPRALSLGAFALLRLGETRRAEKWMRASLERAGENTIAWYNAACFHALRGDTEQALDALKRCRARVGNVSMEWLANDSDLDSLRADPRFQRVVGSIADHPSDSGPGIAARGAGATTP